MPKFPLSGSFLIVRLLAFYHTIPRGFTQDDKLLPVVDTMISVQHINKHCILIKFGGDAVTAINTEKGIVVIDAGISTGLTRLYRKIIENEFNGSEFSYVINTHGHPDHCGGNAVFPEALVIGHENCLQEIADQWKDPVKVLKGLDKVIGGFDRQLMSDDIDPPERARLFGLKTRYEYARADVVNQVNVMPPQITFTDSLNLDMGDVMLHLFYFGNSHSSSDILVFVPAMRLLFTGDLFFKYGTPSIGYDLPVDKQRRNLAVKWVRDRQSGIETIIGGHGQFLTPDDLTEFTERILEMDQE